MPVRAGAIVPTRRSRRPGRGRTSRNAPPPGNGPRAPRTPTAPAWNNCARSRRRSRPDPPQSSPGARPHLAERAPARKRSAGTTEPDCASPEQLLPFAQAQSSRPAAVVAGARPKCTERAPARKRSAGTTEPDCASPEQLRPFAQAQSSRPATVVAVGAPIGRDSTPRRVFSRHPLPRHALRAATPRPTRCRRARRGRRCNAARLRPYGTTARARAGAVVPNERSRRRRGRPRESGRRRMWAPRRILAGEAPPLVPDRRRILGCFTLRRGNGVWG